MKGPAKEFCCMGRTTPKESCFEQNLLRVFKESSLCGLDGETEAQTQADEREVKSHLLHTVAFECGVFLLERRLIHIA